VKRIGSGTLRDGREAQIVLVDTPSPEAAELLVGLLGHKHEPWMWHIRRWAEGGTPGLDLLHYLAEVDGVICGCVANFRTEEIGNVTHVYTVPEWRRLGIARMLLRRAVRDFDEDGGRVLVLGTGFEKAPWRMYQTVGFRGTCPEQGYGGMVRFSGQETWESVLSGPPGQVRPVAWRDFAGSLVLFSAPGPEQLRSVHMASVGPRLVEKTFLLLMQRIEDGGRARALVLPGQGASLLGFAVVGEHPLWEKSGAREVLDFHVHPNGHGGAQALLEDVLHGCSGPIEAYCDSGSEQKLAVLSQAGFREECVSRSALRFGEETRDLVVLSRG
jgi:GNAT superfamily N-acetyltransferase